MKFAACRTMKLSKCHSESPQMQLGIDKRVATIDVGKDADLAIYNHDPLSAYAVVQKAIIDGRVYFERQRDIAERSSAEKKKSPHRQTEKISRKKPEDTKTRRLPAPSGQKPAEKKPESEKAGGKKPEEKPKPPQSSESVQRSADVRSLEVHCEPRANSRSSPLPPLLH